jgi:hypothetical protein
MYSGRDLRSESLLFLRDIRRLAGDVHIQEEKGLLVVPEDHGLRKPTNPGGKATPG